MSYKFEKLFHICNLFSRRALSNCCDPLRESFHMPMIKITYTFTHMLYFYTWKIASTSPIHPQIKPQVLCLSLSKVIIIIYGLYFLFLSLFFLTHLVGVWHTFFGYASFLFFFDMPCGHVAYLLWVCIFYFFLYSPYIMMMSLERDKHGTTWSFICG